MRQTMTKNWLTRKFSDLYPDIETFMSDYKKFKLLISPAVPDTELERIWFFLIAKYASARLRLEELPFRMTIFKDIWTYYPEVYAKIQSQQQLRAVSITDLQKGGKLVTGSAAKPNSPPGTDAMELPYTDNLVAQNSKISLLNAVNQQFQILESEFIDEFIDRFNKYFRQILVHDRDRWFINYLDPEDEEESEE